MATYAALTDQRSMVWYLTADTLADGSTAEWMLSSSLPPGTNVTPSQPSWLAIDDADLTRWYVWPEDWGTVQVSRSAPPLGMGAVYAAGLSLTDTDMHAWRLGVVPWGEVSAAPDPTPVLFVADTLRPRVTEAPATVSISAATQAKVGAETLRPRLTEAPATRTVVAATQQTAADGLGVRLAELSGLKRLRQIVAVDTVRPGVLEAPAQREALRLSVDTVRPRLTETATKVVLVILPPDAVMIPLPQGVFIQTWR